MNQESPEKSDVPMSFRRFISFDLSDPSAFDVFQRLISCPDVTIVSVFPFSLKVPSQGQYGRSYSRDVTVTGVIVETSDLQVFEVLRPPPQIQTMIGGTYGGQ